MSPPILDALVSVDGLSAPPPRRGRTRRAMNGRAMGEYGNPRGLGQRLMESAPVVAVYESRLWRRNPIVEAFMGIAFDAELDCVARAAHLDEASWVLDLACG